MAARAKTPPAGTLNFTLRTTPSREALALAIENGGSCDPRKCFLKVGIDEEMDALEPGVGHHVRVDAGHVKANYKGWRYIADLPLQAKRNLILFDRGRFSEIRIREYKLEFRRTTKIIVVSRERQDQINAARRGRYIAGRPDKKYEKRETEGLSGIV